MGARHRSLVCMAKRKIDRRKSQEFALRTMLHVLGDRAAGSSGFYMDGPLFEDVPRAAWIGLAKKECVRIVDFMGGRPVCFLTGTGWRSALETSGISQSAEFMERVARLANNLRERVQGRAIPAQVSLYQLATDTGLPEGFLWNVIESGVIGREAPYWDPHADGPYMIEIPAGFGKEV